MSDELTVFMAKQTDEKLIAAVMVNRENYTEAILLAAQLELANRNISIEKTEAIRKEQLLIKEKKIFLQNVPLEFEVKLIAVLFPVLGMVIYQQSFRQYGYKRKSAELSRHLFIGVLAYIVLFISFIVITQFSKS